MTIIKIQKKIFIHFFFCVCISANFDNNNHIRLANQKIQCKSKTHRSSIVKGVDTTFTSKLVKQENNSFPGNFNAQLWKRR